MLFFHANCPACSTNKWLFAHVCAIRHCSYLLAPSNLSMSISYVAHAQADTIYSQQNTPSDPLREFKYADQSPDAELTKESFKELNNKPALMRLSWRFWPDSTRKMGLVQVAWELWSQFRMFLTIHQLRRAYKATLRNPDGYVHKSLVCTRFHGGLLLPHCHAKLAKWMVASLTKPGEDWLQSASAEHVPSSDHVGLVVGEVQGSIYRDLPFGWLLRW